jgi:hypothetical protein
LDGTDLIRQLRLRSQRLLDPVGSFPDAAHAVVGIQAQDMPAAALSLRCRTSGLTAALAERARNHDRTLVRTWLMRGTLHLSTVEDVALLLPLMGPRFAADGRRRRLQLKLDDATTERGLGHLKRLLAHGPMPRDTLREKLAAQGIPTAGQALIHLLFFAALEGQVCYGPDLPADNRASETEVPDQSARSAGRSKETFVLLEDWLPADAVRAIKSPPERDKGLAEIARRYLAAFGPATPEDLAAWSGLPMGDVRRGWGQIANETMELPDIVRVMSAKGGANAAAGGASAGARKPMWLLKSRATEARQLASDEPEKARSTPHVRLLPAFDTYLMGYRSRDLTVAANYSKRILPGGGIIRPSLLVNGRVQGTWRIERKRGGLTVHVETFNALPGNMRPVLEAEVADIGHFLGMKASLTVVAPKARDAAGEAALY